MEKPTENLKEETEVSPEAEGKFGLEIEASQAQRIASELSIFADLVNHDKAISEEDLLEMDIAVRGLLINFGGENLSIEETEDIPYLQKQPELWKKIKEEMIKDKTKSLSFLTGGLTFLPSEIAEIISKNEQELWLQNLKFISDEAARYLSQHGIGYRDALRLNRLTSISENTAEHFSHYRGTLFLEGLTELPDAIAEKLSSHKGALFLNGVKTLSDPAAESLSSHEGGLVFAELTEISENVARSLSKTKGFLSIKNINSIPDTIIKHLAEFKGELSLDITSLTDIAAEYLSKHVGRLFLNDEIKNKIAKFKK